MSSAARFSMLLDPPNLLRRAAVALAVGVGMAELKAVPLVELTEEAEGVTEGRAALPTCAHSHTHTHCLVSRLPGNSKGRSLSL